MLGAAGSQAPPRSPRRSGAYLGRQIVGSGDEAGWIQARAAAEGIKSECYRYAAPARLRPRQYGRSQGARRPDGGDRETGRPTRGSCAPTIMKRSRTRVLQSATIARPWPVMQAATGEAV